jgi:hypothetical protein
MPIEIRELVIRATVDPAETGGCGTPSRAAQQASPRGQGHADDDVVQTCVREVLRILADRQER